LNPQTQAFFKNYIIGEFVSSAASETITIRRPIIEIDAAMMGFNNNEIIEKAENPKNNPLVRIDSYVSNKKKEKIAYLAIT